MSGQGEENNNSDDGGGCPHLVSLPPRRKEPEARNSMPRSLAAPLIAP